MNLRDITAAQAAQIMGRLAVGVPKSFTPEERAKRRARMVAMNERRAARKAAALAAGKGGA